MAKKIFMGCVVIALTFVMLQLTAGAATLDVYPGMGTYPNIQSALDAFGVLASGDVINVHAGTYNEDVFFQGTWPWTRENVTIQAAGDDVVTVNSIELYNCKGWKVSGLNFVPTGTKPAINLHSCANFTVENNTMSGGGSVINGDGGENLTVKGNTIATLGGNGIYIELSVSPVVEGNTLYLSSGTGIRVVACTGLALVSGNTVDGIGSLGIVSGSTAGEITGNTITGNIATAIYCVGVAPSDIEISDNVANAATSSTTGIILSVAADNITVSGNECSGYVNWAGIQVSAASTYVITDNVLENNAFGIVIFSSSPMTISGNVCYGNSYGIYGWSGFPLNTTMTNNTLYDNYSGIVLGGDASGATVENSIFAGNVEGLRSSATNVGNEGYNCYYGNGARGYRPNDVTYSLATDTRDNPMFYSETPGDAGFLYLSCDTPDSVLFGDSTGGFMGALPVVDDGDGDGYDCTVDCDDNDAEVYSGAPELCDGKDNDCDGLIPSGEADADGDGRMVCEGDCNDTDPTVYPGAPELCDGIDKNCNGIGSEDETDVDGDGHMVCEGDCNDNDPAIYPGATEICDGVDNDCDDEVDEGVKNTYYRDADGDTFGDLNNTTQACSPPSGYVINNTDCNDSDASIYSGAPELCDSKDNNCNGAVDEGLTFDADGDGHSTPDSCAGTKDDCDDTDATVYPGAPELCDGIDNDCDGFIPADEADADLDTWMICEGDCDDDDATVYPGAPELADCKDNDCDGKVDEDDFTAPSGTISVSPKYIWPPNHEMVNITVDDSDIVDDNLKTVAITDITSSEPDNGLGDGDTTGDTAITGDLTGAVRAERSGKGTGRVYTVTVTATDCAGNVTDFPATVVVPHDRRK